MAGEKLQKQLNCMAASHSLSKSQFSRQHSRVDSKAVDSTVVRVSGQQEEEEEEEEEEEQWWPLEAPTASRRSCDAPPPTRP